MIATKRPHHDLMNAARAARKAEPFSTYADIVISTEHAMGRPLTDDEQNVIWEQMFAPSETERCS
jgi:hypothetical protein